MKINYQGHMQTNCEIELTPEQYNVIFETMKTIFMSHIEFSPYYEDSERSYAGETEKNIRKICNEQSVDISYKKDRLSFFSAVMNQMETPYK